MAGFENRQKRTFTSIALSSTTLTLTESEKNEESTNLNNDIKRKYEKRNNERILIIEEARYGRGTT